MKKTFKSDKISCEHCAKTIKTSLEGEFGSIDVNLDVHPREVTVEISDDTKEAKFKAEMSDIGFNVIED